MYTMAREIIFN